MQIPYTSLTESRLAREYSKIVQEWNGTPFRVDMIRNFPEFVSDEDLRDQLAPIGRLADQTEKQIGYRVVEMGGVIDTPQSTAPNWNMDFERYWRNDSDNSLLPRERGQILVFYMDDDNPLRWDDLGGSPIARTRAAEPSVITNAPWDPGGTEKIVPARGNSPPTSIR